MHLAGKPLGPPPWKKRTKKLWALVLRYVLLPALAALLALLAGHVLYG
jgi:hypothetical protein